MFIRDTGSWASASSQFLACNFTVPNDCLISSHYVHFPGSGKEEVGRRSLTTSTVRSFVVWSHANSKEAGNGGLLAEKLYAR